MKTIHCQHCEADFAAETKEEMLGILYDHYMKDHRKIITSVDETEKKAWMERFEADWNNATELT